MLKKILLSLCTVCLPLFCEAAPVSLDDSNFSSTISKGVVLVDFYADWCGPCRAIAPVIDQLSIDFQGKATIAKVNIDKAKGTTSSFNISSIPIIILFKDGKELKRLVGPSDKQTLKQLISGSL